VSSCWGVEQHLTDGNVDECDACQYLRPKLNVDTKKRF
jgi:hypothetical protein